MSMVLDCIDCFRERTHDGLPIALTDTQSPFDTATLVLDAAEFFAACYAEPEIVAGFLQKITDLIVEFSRVQMRADRAGTAGTAGTPHAELRGRSRGFPFPTTISPSPRPKINRRFALPMDGQLAEQFGGLDDPFLRRLDSHDVHAARLSEDHGN